MIFFCKKIFGLGLALSLLGGCFQEARADFDITVAPTVTTTYVVTTPFAGTYTVTYNPAAFNNNFTITNPNGVTTVSSGFGMNFGACFVVGRSAPFQFSAASVESQFFCNNVTLRVSSNPQAYYSSLASLASLTSIAQETSQVTISAIQGVTTEIRDAIFYNRVRSGGASNSFSWDPSADPDIQNGPFAALGFAKAPAYKATPPAPPSVQYTVWGQTFGDQELRSQTFNGADVGRTTSTFGGLAGIDATFNRAAGTWVLGVLAGDTVANVKNNDGSTARVEGPGVGLYSVYVNGQFSADFVTKADFFSLFRSAALVPTVNLIEPLNLELINYTTAFDVNYRFDLASWFVEPTAGMSYVSTHWDSSSQALGFQNGETFRLQGGARVGTTSKWNNVTVEETLTALAYSDVVVNGGSIVTAVGVPGIPTDQGKVFGQAIGKLNFIWTNQVSSYVEAELRGGEGVLGYAGRIGVRYGF